MTNYEILYKLKHWKLDKGLKKVHLSIEENNFLERYYNVTEESKELIFLPDGYYWEAFLKETRWL